MAFLNEQHCYSCGRVTGHVNGRCMPCARKAAQQRRNQHFDELDKLSLEQRVRRIETLMYDSTQQENITNTLYGQGS